LESAELFIFTAYAYNYYSYLDSSVPVIVGSTVFVLVGLYMMKSGVKKEAPSTQK